MTDRVDISRLLNDMRSLKAQTHAFHRPKELVEGARTPNGMRSLGALNVTESVGASNNVSSKVPSFGDLMTKAISQVNDTQQKSAAMAEAYEKGVAGVDITDVMIASQKASVAFQATVQVRNKLIEAYKDVMNIPI